MANRAAPITAIIVIFILLLVFLLSPFEEQKQQHNVKNNDKQQQKKQTNDTGNNPQSSEPTQPVAPQVQVPSSKKVEAKEKPTTPPIPKTSDPSTSTDHKVTTLPSPTQAENSKTNRTSTGSSVVAGNAIKTARSSSVDNNTVIRAPLTPEDVKIWECARKAVGGIVKNNDSMIFPQWGGPGQSIKRISSSTECYTVSGVFSAKSDDGKYVKLIFKCVVVAVPPSLYKTLSIPKIDYAPE
jgi:hypothetical protein